MCYRPVSSDFYLWLKGIRQLTVLGVSLFIGLRIELFCLLESNCYNWNQDAGNEFSLSIKTAPETLAGLEIKLVNY